MLNDKFNLASLTKLIYLENLHEIDVTKSKYIYIEVLRKCHKNHPNKSIKRKKNSQILNCFQSQTFSQL